MGLELTIISHLHSLGFLSGGWRDGENSAHLFLFSSDTRQYNTKIMQKNIAKMLEVNSIFFSSFVI